MGPDKLFQRIYFFIGLFRFRAAERDPLLLRIPAAVQLFAGAGGDLYPCENREMCSGESQCVVFEFCGFFLHRTVLICLKVIQFAVFADLFRILLRGDAHRIRILFQIQLFPV